ncbi:FAD-dependent oxidoreductase [Paenarthrobacter ilicis]|uniref:Thioredoxin reductase n=1 Tax=Paenarthrobacter ilicis TaxID=43665 RepID=A0ABX0TDH0_9MICC|nr:thioredoxin reductase [Paenarthrobacter ilicis]NIJ00578.1 thioredoxin reductase [Paenarthrobacter ilicis]
MERDSGNDRTLDQYDVVVVGGGSAGLSAAVTLGRARRSVLVVDTGAPRNAPAAGVHGFLSRDGISPLELLALGREEALSYGAVVVNGEVVAARSTAEPGAAAGPAFEVVLADGTVVGARRLLVASGVVDTLPDVAGMQERWGKDVLHCPYCHGWEVKDKAIGIVGSGPMSMHQTLLFRQWSPDITLFLNESVEPTDEQWEQLAARSITVVEGRVQALDVTGDALSGVVLASGKVVPVDAIVAAPRMDVRSAVLESLGIPAVEHPMGVGTYIEADPMGGATSVPGVWAAGNVANPTAQVMASAAAGTMAGAAINADLIMAETKAAVEAARKAPVAL